MTSPRKEAKKRRYQQSPEEIGDVKRRRESDKEHSASSSSGHEEVAGKIKKIVLRNFLCHDHLDIEFNKNVNFIVGRNGSGKSAILTALTVGLGARASTTRRGDSYKTFIQSGKNAFVIEITLTNEGPKAYEPEVYGNIIRIIRTVSHTSSTIVTKSDRGHIISRKKSDVDKITSALNIQVENPIAILNQNDAKSVLISPNAGSLYEFFMRATQLEVIGNNYKEALEVSRGTQMKVQELDAQLRNDKMEIDEIEANIKAIEGLEVIKQEYEELMREYQWARVIVQEKEVCAAETELQKRERDVEKLLRSEQSYNSRSEKIKTEIEELSNCIKQFEEEASEANKSRDHVKQQYDEKKEQLTSKLREQKAVEKLISHTQRDIDALAQEIQRLKDSSGQVDQERTQMTERLEKLQEEMLEYDQMLSTTLLHRSHVDANKVHLEKEEREHKAIVTQKEQFLYKLKRQLNNLSQQEDNSLTVFGRNIPRLQKRIDEEYKKGRFRMKPRGPLGASIKMKDESWTPVVENFLGYGTLSSFCVDNREDSEHLQRIIQEVYQGERSPDIICSKFFDKVHDVRRNATCSDKYRNVLDVMEISDPVIANCLIDQRSPETILLIPKDEEANMLLQNVENVPQNCKRALTKKGDTYYPDPNFKTYAGSVHPHARFLQVSTTQVIQDLKQEIANVEQDLGDAKAKLGIVREKLSKSIHENHNLIQKVTKLRTLKSQVKHKIDELKDKIPDEVSDDRCEFFLSKKTEDENKLAQEKLKLKRLAGEVSVLQDELKTIEIKLNRCRDVVHGVDEKINPLRRQIRKLEEEKSQCSIHVQQMEKKVQDARRAVQKEEGNVQVQKRVMMQYLAEAEAVSTRIETNRHPDQVKKLVAEKKSRVDAVQTKYGTKENLQQQLKVKKKKYLQVYKVLKALMATNTEHLERVESRRKEYKDMRTKMGQNVEEAFSNFLSLRNYRGSLRIDYDNKVLNLDVIPQNTKQREKNETMTLSGGERSYATVAFLLALWECTILPFHFLDEFDVFMDKVNRRIIMAILLDHARDHPKTQFGFLTPLDGSIVQSSEHLTIHRLATPQRGSVRRSQEE